ncbi:MAG: hypothetical protein A2142_06015 [candidate division Zixibacteria bacterium RBG_16_48_11]|nr:MAG: hypothetical protein A2142_06015 [candidate division Zixibacteria bacterium RBG_16_48_11]
MQMHFDWRDLFKAPRLAISTGKRLILQTLGLLIGYVGYLILTYLAYLLSGQPVAETWNYFGLFPFYDFGYGHWLSAVIWILGLLFFFSFWLLFSTAVAKVTFEELRGDQFYSTREALRFLKERISAVLFSPLTLFTLIVILVIVGAVLGLIGRIPAVGELFFGLFYGVPIFVSALFTVFVAFVFFVSLVLTPAVVGSLKSDTFTTVVEYFQTVWNQPGRFFGYTALTVILAKLGMFVFGYFIMRTFQLINWACGFTMGSKLDDLFQAAMSYLPLPNVLDFFTTLYPGSSIGYHFAMAPGGTGLGITEGIAAFLIGITLIIIFFLMVGYGLATFTCGQTIAFLITYKHREGENLLERKSEEEEAKISEVEGKIEEKLEPQTKS